VPAVVTHQHRFDHLPVAKSQQELARQTVAAVDLIDHFRRIEEKRIALTDVGIDPALERWQEIATGQILPAVAVQRAPQRLGMVRNHPARRQDIHHFGKSEIVQ
jgi:hypothetical protein